VCGKHRRDEIEDTREKILGAAIQRFSKFGYRRTSIDDVAEEAGVARATVYIPLLEEEGRPVRRWAGAIQRTLLEPRRNRRCEKRAAAERIRAMIMTQYGVTADIVHGTPSGHELFQANLHFGRAVVEECLRHGEKLLTGLLQQGIRDGEFDLRRSSRHAADIARIIVSFAQNSLLDTASHTSLVIGKVCAKR